MTPCLYGERDQTVIHCHYQAGRYGGVHDHRYRRREVDDTADTVPLIDARYRADSRPQSPWLQTRQPGTQWAIPAGEWW